ncbi:MAG: UDP-N-acetylmuramoyl-tripeptide--D-alanyl-D-alanine ligase [bacterium]|nr:UDP-N-acetylmuramoyl-tripeptide--D-alanyl-D-alanine ligase [bacterium]
MKAILKPILISILILEAKAAVRRYKPRIIAVTGSVGKTSTKDAIYAVVSGTFVTRKSEKSFNSEIGLPLAVLGLPNAWSSISGWASNIWEGALVAFGPRRKAHFPELLVLEVGADHPGDIARAVSWIVPDIAVLTRMSSTPVHVEYFSGPEEVLHEKMRLALAVPHDGLVIVNADDPLFMGEVAGLSVRKATYGENKDADVRIAMTEFAYEDGPLSLPKGLDVDIDTKAHQSLKISLQGVLGTHLAYPVAAAMAVAQELNIDPEVAAKALSTFEPPKGRMRILSGKGPSAVLDDTYNSSPIAVEEALKALDKISFNRGRKIAALADMKELGAFSDDAHIKVGELAGGIVHTLVVVGEAARAIARGARGVGLAEDRIVAFDTSAEAAEFLAEFVRAGDVVLVKGSQSMRMERVSKALIYDPSAAPELLVRQEKEWETR